MHSEFVAIALLLSLALGLGAPWKLWKRSVVSKARIRERFRYQPRMLPARFSGLQHASNRVSNLW